MPPPCGFSTAAASSPDNIQGLDGTGRIGWRACGRSESRPQVVRRAREFYVVVLEAGLSAPSLVLSEVFEMPVWMKWAMPCCWRWNYHRRWRWRTRAGVLGVTAFSCQLSCVDCGRSAPERQGRGSCWAPLACCSQPLSVSRRCQRSLKANHVVRRHVYALRLCHGAAYDKAVGQAIRSLNGFRGPREAGARDNSCRTCQDSCDRHTATTPSTPQSNTQPVSQPPAARNRARAAEKPNSVL